MDANMLQSVEINQDMEDIYQRHAHWRRVLLAVAGIMTVYIICQGLLWHEAHTTNEPFSPLTILFIAGTLIAGSIVLRIAVAELRRAKDELRTVVRNLEETQHTE